MSTRQTIKEEETVSELTDVVTPVLTVNEELTVEQRMTDNAVENILPARYLEKNGEGEIVETPAGLFERVADNVAEAEFLHGGEEDFEHWKGEFEHQMKTLRFMPNSPTLMNAGLPLQQLSACFVLEPGDSMTKPDENGRDSILDSVKNAGAIFKSGGGVGYSFHHLRPKGTLVSSTKGTSSGPLSFMRLFDETCNTVKQGGKRRGAQMAIMRVDHPDIGRFAVCKREEGAFSNFNISTALTDEFVEAVENDETYTLYAPSTGFDEEFEIVEDTKNFYAPSAAEMPESVVDENIWRDHADDIDAWDWDEGKTTSFREKWEDTFKAAERTGKFDEGKELVLPARFIWDIMIDGAWRNGEPGLFYLDETNREHTFDTEEHPEYEINATNPCAEQPLCNYEACNLGHINLSLMLKDDAISFDQWRDEQDHDYRTDAAEVVDYVNTVIDYDELDRTIETGARFLDNVVTQSDFPLDKIEDQVSSMRKIGLGVMGWAQMLYQMGIPYGSDESYAAARHVMSYIDAQGTWNSHKLAEERGSFDAWDKSKFADPTAYPEWFETHAHQDPQEWEDGFPVRNHNITTVAPTGTTSMLADTSGGIEPVYNVAYKKNVGNDIQGADKLVEFDSYFVQTLEANDIDVDEIKEIAAEQMDTNSFEGVQGLPIPERLKEIFVTTNDLTSRQHGLMQRAFQEAVDSGISKTVNLPNDADHSDVHDAYMLALTDDEIGAPIKGLTVYRDGSREEQVLSTGEETKASLDAAREKLEQAGYEVIETNGGDNE